LARVSLDHKQHDGHAHGASDDHAHGASDDHTHDADVEEKLAPDEQPTPLWLPVIGALLFFFGFILIAAF
jgi:hypothetical protein